MNITFSINRYDYEGDKIEDGLFLHFGGTCVKVADDHRKAPRLKENIDKIVAEIVDNY